MRIIEAVGPIALAALSASITAQRILPTPSPGQLPRELPHTLRADFDGDGQLDLLALPRSVGEPWRLSKGDGSGLFAPAVEVASPPGTPHWWDSQPSDAAGDFDGDGDTDVVFLWISSSSPGIQVSARMAVNDGSGNFQLGSAMPAGDWLRLTPADLDLDGDLDLLAQHFGPDDVEVWQNDGTGNFSVLQEFTTAPTHYAYRSLLADIDADGDLDLLTGQVWCNQGNGTFVDCTATHAPGGLPVGRYAFGDLNGDGFGDLITPAAVLLNNGAGVLQQSSTLPGQGHAELMDIDDDGDLDALLTIPWVTTASGAGELRILHNDGAGAFSAAPAGTAPTMPGISWLEAADADGDGDQDLWTYSTVGQSLLVNDGSGKLLDSSPLALAEFDFSNTLFQFVHRFATGDVDGDGDTDVVSETADGIQTFVNDGLGNFSAPGLPFAAPVAFEGEPALIDLNGDGHLDLLRGDRELYEGDGAGGFAFRGLLPGASPPFAFADIDGDGDRDIVWKWGVNKNLGGFAFSSSSAGLPQSHPAALAAADFDGDGDVDLYYPGTSYSSGSTPDRIYRNNGLGQFSDQSSLWLPATPSTCYAAKALDLDADGDQDLICSGTIGSFKGIWTYLNNGAGVMTAGLQLAVTLPPAPIYVADFDLDGDVDVFGITPHPLTPRKFLFEQTGTGFVDRTQNWFDQEHLTFATRVADLDGDGDQDLMTWRTAAGMRVWHNRTRQLTAPNLGRTGDRFVLEARAEIAAELVVPLVSSSPLTTAQPTPFGPLRIDSNTAVALAFAQAAPGSRATWQIPIPAQASLIGIELFSQALHLPDVANLATWRLSNAVRHRVVE